MATVPPMSSTGLAAYTVADLEVLSDDADHDLVRKDGTTNSSGCSGAPP